MELPEIFSIFTWTWTWLHQSMHTGVNKNSFSATFNLWSSTRSDAQVADLVHMLDADSWAPSNHVTPRSSDPTAPICQLASTPKMEILCFQDLIIARISYRYDNRKLKNISSCPLLTISIPTQPNQPTPTRGSNHIRWLDPFEVASNARVQHEYLKHE